MEDEKSNPFLKRGSKPEEKAMQTKNDPFGNPAAERRRRTKKLDLRIMQRSAPSVEDEGTGHPPSTEPPCSP
jgi:hypothetical protein